MLLMYYGRRNRRGSMAYKTENTLDLRKKRYEDALALKEPDRVPFAPKMGKSYSQLGGISNYEATTDFRNLKESIRLFLEKYELDCFRLPSLYPISVMEVLGTNYIKWPGATHGLELNALHQIIDRSYLAEDEYDEFLNDPTAYIFTKVFPDRHDKLQGLRKLDLSNIIEFGHFMSMAPFADPEVRQALLTLMFAGEQVAKFQQQQAEISAIAAEMQAPSYPTVGQPMAYDMLADNLRGYINVPMDLFTCPEKVLAATEYFQWQCEKALRKAAAIGRKFVYIPLHGGTDDFMSNETYNKYYWPFLRRMIELCVELDMTPQVFCEGKYDTRLEILAEVPKGKVMYMFENVDMARAKKILGGVACITGQVSSADLIYGKKEDVIEQTKRYIDICAPGGGFIMDCSITLDIYKEENLEAWYETTLKYGVYK